MTFIRTSPLILIALALTSSLLRAEPMLPNTVKEMRLELDRVNFDLKGNNAKIKRLEEVLPHSEALAKKNAKDAGFQMMAGFYNAQYAGYKGGIGALKYAKASRKYLEKSVKLDPTLYGSSAHAVLGTLYAQVPGWPIGFGDKKKALNNYQSALKFSPNGLDSNFTYAQYLFNQKKYKDAKRYLEKAAQAPSRPDRTKADENVSKQITKGLKEIEQRLAENG
ncbi:MAG: tetratricopeptide (TPR) repeat protein [Arenicella sp.]|jgi:tetratricopeptide (TPR) repeat protein